MTKGNMQSNMDGCQGYQIQQTKGNKNTKYIVSGPSPGMWVAATFMDGEFSNLTFQLGADAEDGGSHGVSKK